MSFQGPVSGDDLVRLRATLDQIISRHPRPAIPVHEPHRRNVVDTVACTLARAEYQDRRRRRKAFGADSDLFGEPAWDILLELFMATERGDNISITSACVAAEVPATTALRCIRNLEKRKLVTREADPFDSRRTFLRLTELGADRMRSHFQA